MSGRIEVFCGPMFSGKSLRLIVEMQRAEIQELRSILFKPRIDTRYSESKVTSHNKHSREAVVVDTVAEMRNELETRGMYPGKTPNVKAVEVIGIDEGQFLGNDLPKFCDEMASLGVRVLVSGLDQDFSGRPFDPIPELMARAEQVTKLDAVCRVCKGTATRTFRKSKSKERVQIGAEVEYEPRCRKCHSKKPD